MENVTTKKMIKRAYIKDIRITLVKSVLNSSFESYTCEVQSIDETTSQTLGSKLVTASRYFDMMLAFYKNHYAV